MPFCVRSSVLLLTLFFITSCGQSTSQKISGEIAAVSSFVKLKNDELKKVDLTKPIDSLSEADRAIIVSTVGAVMKPLYRNLCVGEGFKAKFSGRDCETAVAQCVQAMDQTDWNLKESELSTSLRTCKLTGKDVTDCVDAGTSFSDIIAGLDCGTSMEQLQASYQANLALSQQLEFTCVPKLNECNLELLWNEIKTDEGAEL